MTFKFPCPHCGQRIAATSEDCGSEGTCKTCENNFTVPEAPEPEAPPPTPEPEEVPGPEPGSPKRRGRKLWFVLLVLLLAGGAAGYFLWPFRSPEAVASKMYEATIRMDAGAIRRLVTADSLSSLEGMEKDMEAMRQKSPDQVEQMKKAKVEVASTTYHGSMAAVGLRVMHPDPKKKALTPTIYTRRTWLGWRVDLPSDAQMRTDLVNAKQIEVAIRMYEGDNGGKLPKDLQELVPRYLTDAKVLLSPLAPGSTEPGYEYFGSPEKQRKPTERLLQSKVPALDGTRAVTYGDGKTVRE